MMKKKQSDQEEEERETGALPLDGDILDSVVSHVPTLDLISASHVSSTWRLAVASSLCRSPRLKPFLLLHLQSRRRSSSLAYDPHSRSWAPLPDHAILTCPPALLRSSLPSLLFSLSPSRLSLSLSRPHPLAATWLHLPPPRVSRVDPVIALVAGPSLVVAAAGSCEFEDLPVAVEVLDLNHPSAGWAPRDPLPDAFAQSASATWLSVATSDDRLFVLDKDSGLFCSFDPRAGKWSRTCNLKPDPTTLVSAIGYSNNRLVLVGLSGEDPDAVSMRMWEVGLDSDAAPIGVKDIGRMPQRMVEVLTRSSFGLTRIGFGLVGDFGYFYNPGDFGEGAVFWEIGKGRWEWVDRPDALDEDPTVRIVFGCARVIGEVCVRGCGCELFSADLFCFYVFLLLLFITIS